MNREKHRDQLDTLPTGLVTQCKHIADGLRTQNEDVRDDKILTARVRMCSGYYDSENVLRMIAARLLSEGSTQPDSSLAG